MVSSEIKETIAIAVSAIILASLLSFIAYSMQLGYAMSTTHNNDVYTKESLASFKEFSKFEGRTELNHTDIVAAIRDYYTTDTDILVMVNPSTSLLYTKESAILNSNSVTYETLQAYYLNNGAQGMGNYDSYLVYGAPDLKVLANRIKEFRAKPNPTIEERKAFQDALKPSAFDTGVTGIIFVKK